MTLVLMSLTLFTYALITVVFLKCLYDFSLLLHYTVIINSMSFHCYNLFGALYEYRIVFCTYFHYRPIFCIYMVYVFQYRALSLYTSYLSYQYYMDLPGQPLNKSRGYTRTNCPGLSHDNNIHYPMVYFSACDHFSLIHIGYHLQGLQCGIIIT